jgi:hypothetical protein
VVNVRLVFLLAILLALGSASASLDSGLLHYWDFDGDADDALKLANGTVSGASNSVSYGFNNEGYSFDGDGDVIDISEGPSLSLIEPFSVSLWAKPDMLPTERGILIGNFDDGSEGFEVFTRANAADIFIQMRGDSGFNRLQTKYGVDALPNDVWTHLVVTYDGSNDTSGFSMYLNGTEVSLTSVDNDATIDLSANLDWGIGARPGGYSEEYKGFIDEVALYNRTLNSTEVSELYNSGSGEFFPFVPKPEAPTNVAATDGTHTDKVTVTWTKSTNATGYHIYTVEDGFIASVGDVATYDYTSAPKAYYPAGNASASDGTSTDHVSLNVTLGNSGDPWYTTKTYLVVAEGSGGNSTNSSTDSGYRGIGSPIYEWQRSAGDSDADYTAIEGATTVSYNDTGAPADGSGRYYRFRVTATGGATSISVPDRGYRSVITSYSLYCEEAYTLDELVCSEAGPFKQPPGSHEVEANVTGYYSITKPYVIGPSNFSYTGDWIDPLNLNDSDTNTGSTVTSLGEGNATYTFSGNYSLSNVTLSDSSGSWVETLPTDCSINPQLRVRITKPEIGGGITLYCYNGSDWELLRSNNGFYTVYELYFSDYKIPVFGFYSFNLTIMPGSDYGGAANFSVNLSNAELGLSFSNESDGSSLNYALLSGYEYALGVERLTEVPAPYYANVSNTTAPPQSRSINASLGAARTVTFDYYYEENLSVFDREVILRLTPIDDTTNTFYEANTSNGTSELIHIPVGEYEIRMSSEGYQDEYRYVRLGSRTSAEFDGYFQTNDTGSVKTFNVVDRSNIAQNGWYLKAQRYYNGTGWITVDEGRSNIDGTLLLNLLSDEYYRVILIDDDFTVQYKSQRSFLPSATYEVSPSATIGTNTQIDKTRGLETTIEVKTHLNGTGYLEATGVSTSGTRDWKLDLYRYYMDGPQIISSTTGSGDAVTLSVNVPNATARYEAVLSITGSQIPVTALGYTYGGGATVLGGAGGVFAFILLLAIVGVGTFSAPVAIVMSIVGLIVANLIGIFTIGVASIIGLIFAGGLILFRRNA